MIQEENTTLISTKHLNKSYKKGKITIPAIRDVSCKFERGQYISIVGKSGSGKSTLLNLIGGLDTADSGEILFNNRNLMLLSRREMANHRRFSIGMVFQSFNLITHKTALENVMLALAFGGTGHIRRKGKALKLLEMVGLSERTDHLPNELSGGEAQRVSIARALANKPLVLLADEPTGNLDSSTSEEIIALLEKLNKENELTIIMVTHDKETAIRVSNHIIELKDGMILEEKFY